MRLRIYLFLTLLFIVVDVFAKDVRKLCTSILGSRSCGQCIKQHPECAWCLDPHLVGSSRCDLKSQFQGKCSPSLIYSPTTEVRIIPQNNLPLGNKHADGLTVVQLEPQQVVLKMKPGDIVEVPFKYLHRPHQPNQHDFVIQTSEFRSLGVGIEFSILCGGKRVQGRQCPNVRAGDRIEFFAKVSLNECKSGGDIAISIGAYGYHTVSAMYITPFCGCDCEKMQNQERQSPLCYGSGDLICGVCECQPGKGGSHCECDLREHGVSSAQELENKCRKTPNDLICSGNGQCKCGRCVCSVENVHGNYCECENMACPTVQGRLCAGQGECSCGKCRCEEGYTGEDCSCALDTTPCVEGGKICNEQGTCECGKCVCHKGFTGLTCGIVAGNEVLDEDMPKLGESTEHGDDDDDDEEGGQHFEDKELKSGSKDFRGQDVDDKVETMENPAEVKDAKEEEEHEEEDDEGFAGAAEEQELVAEHEKNIAEGDDMENEDAGEVLPPAEDSTDDDDDGTLAETGTAAGEGIAQEPVHEEQTADGLRIESSLLFLPLALQMLFWP